MGSFANTDSRAVLHVDGDAFFASVEESLDPSLRGRPVVVGKERGIAASMNYEAKRRGVTRAMKIHEVKALIPECAILPSDYETYSLVSKRLFSILRRFTPEVEESSIDEGYADITGLRRLYKLGYDEIALKMKAALEAELGLTVSMGLCVNKTLAKICSRWKKPAGFTHVGAKDLERFLRQVPVSAVNGFGPNTTSLLGKKGVYTAFDYVSRPEPWARDLLGKTGSDLWHELRGERVWKVETGPAAPQASLSKVKTFTPPVSDRDFVHAQLLRNLESAFIKLRRHGLRTTDLYVMLRDADFNGSYAGAQLTRATASTLEAAPTATLLFARLYKPGVKYRQTGIYMGKLDADVEVQFDLFEDPCRAKSLKRISVATDRINARFGKHTLHLASTDRLNRYSQHLGDRGDQSSRKTALLPGETFRQHIRMPIWKIAV